MHRDFPAVITDVYDSPDATSVLEWATGDTKPLAHIQMRQYVCDLCRITFDSVYALLNHGHAVCSHHDANFKRIDLHTLAIS